MNYNVRTNTSPKRKDAKRKMKKIKGKKKRHRIVHLNCFPLLAANFRCFVKKILHVKDVDEGVLYKYIYLTLLHRSCLNFGFFLQFV